jgi:DNA mismatch repair protein MSH5
VRVCLLQFSEPDCELRRLSSMNELGQLLDEDMKEEEVSALEVCENICRRFLKWDLEGCEEHEDARDKVGKLLEKPVDVVNRE